MEVHKPQQTVLIPRARNAREWPSGSRPCASIQGISAPRTHRTIVRYLPSNSLLRAKKE
jgi:hypothetical protein